MPTPLSDVIGSRGEKIAELCLSDFASFNQPLFQAVHLGDKWPGIDFYVELNGIKGKRPFFFAQCKTTAKKVQKHLSVSLSSKAIAQLLEIPGPTYLFGVHEPTLKVFAKSIHAGLPVTAITRIKLQNELTPQNLIVLFNEVEKYWQQAPHKPTGSAFT